MSLIPDSYVVVRIERLFLLGLHEEHQAIHQYGFPNIHVGYRDSAAHKAINGLILCIHVSDLHNTV